MAQFIIELRKTENFYTFRKCSLVTATNEQGAEASVRYDLGKMRSADYTLHSVVQVSV